MSFYLSVNKIKYSYDMNGWMNEWKWMSECMNGWMSERMDGWMNE